MRKSGWAAAAGLGSLVQLLTACGGSSGSSSTSTSTPPSTAQPAGQPTSALGSLPPKGSVVLIVQHSALGWVLAAANGQVVYTYDKDTKGSAPTCTGSCAATWVPLTANPVASSADTGLGALSTVSTANGAKQITYNGMPLYTFKGAKSLTTSGNGMGGVWHVVKMSASNVSNGG